MEPGKLIRDYNITQQQYIEGVFKNIISHTYSDPGWSDAACVNEEPPATGRSDRVWVSLSRLITELCIFTPDEVSEVMGFELRPPRALAK